MRAKYPDLEGSIDRDGVNIHYEVYGEGAETLLFMPAWAIVHSRMWKAQIPYFSQYYRCITFDPRGNGKSDRPEEVEKYAIHEYVADALAVLDATNTKQATLLGVSLGGLLAPILAAHYPERVRALVAICPASTIGPDLGYATPDRFFGQTENHEGWEKYSQSYWHEDYEDFTRFFIGQIFPEPHSTKQIQDGVSWSLETDGQALGKTVEARMTLAPHFTVNEDLYRNIKCPVLVIHGTEDRIQAHDRGKFLAALMQAEFISFEGAGHNPQARFPAKTNALILDFLDKILARPRQTLPDKNGDRNGIKYNANGGGKRVLYLSSPIGLGHARRDLAIAQELRKGHPDIQVDWLAQDPVTRFLDAADETLHPASALLANESNHIEAEAGEHDLNAFQAIRNMDEILIANFMVFQEVLEQQKYDLVIADEAWDVDHFWHEHPELKQTQLAWFTDFVGFIPMPDGGPHEAYLTADYNAEMIEHIQAAPNLRDRAIFVGNPDDIVPGTFGPDLPDMRSWTESHFDFCGYITGFEPDEFARRAELRERFGYREGEKVCIVTVGGSGVGGHLLRRVMDAYPAARARVPELRMIVVTGPRIDPASLVVPPGVETRAF
ncbi:MAG: alpha/beta fold hydrolase, partial [Rhodospirillaceae bacterium]|nr:alpha/beta fold hydrolase [Rhodospirillaceae bacterium]